MMPGLQLARGGGQVLDNPGLSERFNALPRRCETELSIQFADGMLAFGDFAGTMSPMGGVGIHLAIQDTVATATATANRLGSALRGSAAIDEAQPAAVQQRCEWPTRINRSIQVQMQRRLIAPALRTQGGPPNAPGWLRWVMRFHIIHAIPAHVLGLGFRRERVLFDRRDQ